MMTQETFPGAPDDKNVESKGKPETHYFLNLSSPVCLAPREGDPVNKAVPAASKIQLRFAGDAAAMQEKLKPYLNAVIKCTGGLFLRHAPHHHTEVLMMTGECNPVAVKSP